LESLKGQDDLEDTGADGKSSSIKNDPKEMGWECNDYITVARNRGHWLTLVNMAMNVIFQVLTAVDMKIISLWDIALCSSLK
jgi:hypothetical protein